MKITNLKIFISVGVLLLFVVAFTGWYVNKTAETDKQIRADSRPVQKDFLFGVFGKGQVSRKEEWRSHADPRIDGMRNAYKASNDMANFFNWGMAHPEAGGFYYARMVHFECASIHAATSRFTGSLPAEVSGALTRCGNVGTSVSSQKIVGLAHADGASEDPLLTMSKASLSMTLGGAYDLDTAKLSLQHAIQLGDPYELQEQFFRSLNVANTFDGIKITPVVSAQLAAAASIVSCDLGADCTRLSSVPLSCIRDSGCQASLIDLTLNGKSDAERVAIFQLSQRIMSSTFDGTLPSLLGRT